MDPETKRYSKRKYVASFVGFVPSEKTPPGHSGDDRRTLKAIIYGGLVAGPVFREVGTWALNHLRISPHPSLLGNIQAKSAEAREKPENTSEIVNASASEAKPPLPLQSGQLPDFKGLGMREVLKRTHALGLKVRLEGSGLATNQSPDPGSSLETIKSVKVNFKPPM